MNAPPARTTDWILLTLVGEPAKPQRASSQPIAAQSSTSGSAFLYVITRRIWNGRSAPNFSVTVKSAGSFARHVSMPVPMSRVAIAVSPSISSFSR